MNNISFVFSRNMTLFTRAALTVVVITLVINNSRCLAKRSTKCSSDFSLIGTKCYFFSKETANWGDAFYKCLSKNSSLLIVDNAKEERQIRSFLKRNSYTNNRNHHWMGGKYDWKNAKWVWAESGKSINSKNLDSLPQLKDQKLLLQWTCLLLDPSKTNMWSHSSCLQQKQFICQKKPRHPITRRMTFDLKLCKKSASQLSEIEKKKCLKLIGGYGGIKFTNVPAPIIQTPKPTRKNVKEYVCPSNMFVIKNRCYHFSQEVLNWNDAYWSCRNNKTYLAVVQSKLQDKLLKEFLNSGLVERHERWIGGLYDWKQRRWLWANSGKSMKYHDFPFRNNLGVQFEWKSVTIDPDLGNMWNARLRTDLKHYICQKKAKTMAKLGDFNTEEKSIEELNKSV